MMFISVDLPEPDGPMPKAVEKALRKRAVALADFIRTDLGQTRLHGLDFGPHQMTGIHDLKVFWGKGAQVDVRAV